MYWKYITRLLLLAFLQVTFAQQGQQTQDGNQTLLQMLNSTSNGPTLKFVQLLQSSPNYQPILDLLSNSSSNITVFVPSDQALDAMGQQSSSMNNTGTNNMSSTGGSGSSGSPADGPIGVYFSSLLFGQSNPTSASMQASATAASSQMQASSASSASPTSTTTMGTSGSDTGGETASEISSFIEPFLPEPTSIANALPNLAKYIRRTNAEVLQSSDATVFGNSVNNFVDQASSNSTSNTSLINQFNMIDVLYYHVLNQSLTLENSTMILNTLLTNSSVDKLGYGLPILIQQSQQQDSQSQPPQQPQPPQQTQPPQQPQPSQQPQQPQQQFQMLHKRQQMSNETSNNGTSSGGQSANTNSSMWTVGTGIENSTAAISNQTIKASNGVAYIIDKILTPPLSPNQTLGELANASSFDSLLGQTSNNSLDTSNNITLFVPVNQALQSVNASSLDSQVLNQVIQAHVVPGVYYSTNLTSQPTLVTSFAGTNLSLTNADSTSNNSMQVNGTNVVHANILLNNGVMHLIDGVLNYTSSQSSANTTGTSSTSTNNSPSSALSSSTSMGSSPTNTVGGSSGGSNGNNGQSGTNNPFPAPTGSFANKEHVASNSILVTHLTLVLLSYALF